MLRSLALVAALCLLCTAGSVSADFDDGVCGGRSNDNGGASGLPGGWAPIDATSDDILSVTSEAVAQYESVYGVNVTQWLACEDPDMDIVGCQQVVEGTNYKLYANITCPDTDGTDLTVGMEVDAYRALNGTIQILDVDVDILTSGGPFDNDDDDDGFGVRDDDNDDEDDDNSGVPSVVGGAVGGVAGAVGGDDDRDDDSINDTDDQDGGPDDDVNDAQDDVNDAQDDVNDDVNEAQDDVNDDVNDVQDDVNDAQDDANDDADDGPIAGALGRKF